MRGFSASLSAIAPHYVLIEVRGSRLRPLRINAAPASALFLLCLLWAVASLRSDLLPGSPPQTDSSPLVNQAGILALFATITAATAFVRKVNWPRGRSLLGAALIGVGLLALPALWVELAKGHVDDSTRVLLFSLVPVFAVVLEPHLGSTSQGPQRGCLAAALVAVAGTVLIFPLDLPRASASAAAFGGGIIAAASVAAANCTAVKIAQSQTTLSPFG